MDIINSWVETFVNLHPDDSSIEEKIDLLGDELYKMSPDDVCLLLLAIDKRYAHIYSEMLLQYYLALIFAEYRNFPDSTQLVHLYNEICEEDMFLFLCGAARYTNEQLFFTTLNYLCNNKDAVRQRFKNSEEISYILSLLPE